MKIERDRFVKRLFQIITTVLTPLITSIIPLFFIPTRVYIPVLINNLLLRLLWGTTAYKLGLVSDFDISRREERPLFSSIDALIFMLPLPYALQIGDIYLIQYVVILSITALLFAYFSQYEKISGHVTYLTVSASLIFLWRFDLVSLIVGMSLIILVAVSRLYLEKHTRFQVTMGFLIALVEVFTIHILIYYS